MQRRVIMAGFGGQGVLAMGQLLAYAAMIEDKYVTWMPSYGPEMRGGSANCSVIISDTPIGAPNISKATDIVVMNQPSYEKFLDRVQEGGNLLVNASLIDKKETRDDIKTSDIPVTEIAKKMGMPKVGNMVMLGAYLELTQAVKVESVIKAFTKVFGDKKKKFIPINRTAMENGGKVVRGEELVFEEKADYNKTPEQFANKETEFKKIDLKMNDEIFEDDITMVEYAIYSEKEGISFYKAMADKYSNSEASLVFKTLAEQEEDHVLYLNKLLDNLKGEDKEQEELKKPEKVSLDWGNAQEADSSMALSTFSIGMSLEDDAVKFYQKGIEKTDNENIKKLFDELIYWERYHYDQLKGQYDQYKEIWWSSQNFSRM